MNTLESEETCRKRIDKYVQIWIIMESMEKCGKVWKLCKSIEKYGKYGKLLKMMHNVPSKSSILFYSISSI